MDRYIAQKEQLKNLIFSCLFSVALFVLLINWWRVGLGACGANPPVEAKFQLQIASTWISDRLGSRSDDNAARSGTLRYVTLGNRDRSNPMISGWNNSVHLCKRRNNLLHSKRGAPMFRARIFNHATVAKESLSPHTLPTPIIRSLRYSSRDSHGDRRGRRPANRKEDGRWVLGTVTRQE